MLLADVRVTAEQLDSLEWQAIAEGEVSLAARRELAAGFEEVRDTLRRVGAADSFTFARAREQTGTPWP
jgi:hypothetical protein